jgi:hypothetical protein
MFCQLVSQHQPSQVTKASTNLFGTALKGAPAPSNKNPNQQELLYHHHHPRRPRHNRLLKLTAKLQLLRQDIMEKEETTNGEYEVDITRYFKLLHLKPLLHLYAYNYNLEFHYIILLCNSRFRHIFFCVQICPRYVRNLNA